MASPTRSRFSLDTKAQFLIVAIYVATFGLSFWIFQTRSPAPLPAARGAYCQTEMECARRVMAPREHSI